MLFGATEDDSPRREGARTEEAAFTVPSKPSSTLKHQPLLSCPEAPWECQASKCNQSR